MTGLFIMIGISRVQIDGKCLAEPEEYCCDDGTCCIAANGGCCNGLECVSVTCDVCLEEIDQATCTCVPKDNGCAANTYACGNNCCPDYGLSYNAWVLAGGCDGACECVTLL